MPLIYFVLVISATARPFGWAARAAYFPKLVPREIFSNAVTWNSSLFQVGSVVGPAVGGLLLVRAGFPFIYVLDAFCALTFFALVVPIKSGDQGGRAESNPWASLVAGLRSVLSKKVIPGTITLDMVAVLLGGATALLPIFADPNSALRHDRFGLDARHAGHRRLRHGDPHRLSAADETSGQNVALGRKRSGLGLATIGFGLSHWLWFSLAMLFLTGVFDSVSFVIRHTIIQLLTPDEMRGRISVGNISFIGTRMNSERSSRV